MDTVGRKTLKIIKQFDSYLEEAKDKNAQYKTMNIDLKKLVETFKWSNQWIQK